MKKIILIPLISGVVLIAGIISSLYTQVWNPCWNPFINPDKVLKEALGKMADLKTFSQQSQVTIKGDPDSMSFLTKTNVDYDLTQSENPKVSGDFKIEFSTKIPEEELTPQITPFVTGGKLTLFLEGEGKQINKESYLKIKTIPFYTLLKMQMSIIGINLADVKDNWIRIVPEAISQWTGVEYKGLETEKTKELQERIKKSLKEKKILSVKNVFKDEKIDNVMCYHYLVSVNPEELKGTILEIWEDLLKDEKFDEVWEKLEGIEFEIFIGKENKFIKKLFLEKEIVLQEFASENEEIPGKASIELIIINSNFNQPISISVPIEYKDLQEILGPILMKLMQFQAIQSIPTQ